MRFRGYRLNQRWKSGNPTRYDLVVDFVMLAIIVTFSFVGFIPFYLAANTVGEVAVYALVAVNLGLMRLGYKFLWRKWQVLRDAFRGDEFQQSSIPTVSPKD